MTNKQLKVFAPSKVDIDHPKIEAYLKGERIYPTTMEIDLTQLCTRACSGCPYGVSRKAGLTLELPFLDRLLGILGPHTPGLVLSGGESTIVPHFGQVLALARKKGFKEIALISNGGHTHKPHVQDALLEHVTSIRISLYDWQDGKSEYFIKTLDKIRILRNRIDKEGSRLEIGASMLTRSEWNSRYEAVALEALAAGADWIYFHPYCVDWDKTHPVQADQTGVLDAIENIRAAAPQNANIQVPLERYSEKPLHFKKLHGSYFLIHVGADGIIYAGPECKYEKDFALLDLHEYMKDDFLWHPQRLMRLGQFTSDNYRYIGTKHRPPMFSDHIQKIIDLRKNHRPVESLHEPSSHFSYPCII
jgi:MoaA/NifB/PqqE/SkfB family radical SAM enzyme